jgi:hypothetical protein
MLNPLKLIAPALLIVVAACVSDASGSASTPLTLAELDDRVSAGPTRIDVDMLGGLSARELHVEAMEDDEYIESVATAADVAAGTITLELGGLVVDVSGARRFRTLSGDELARDAFLSALAADIAAGSSPFLRVERPASGAASDPADATFVASEVRLDDLDSNKLEMVVDGDNLDGTTLRVLGLAIDVSGADLFEDGPGGGDDGPLHDVGDDNGTDDPATHDVGDDHGGGGADDGAGHT